MNRFDRFAIASRAFIFAAILGLAAASGSLESIQGAVLLGAISATATLVALATRLPDATLAMAEASLVALLIGTALPHGAILLPYLVVPTLIAGTARGFRGVALVVVTEVACLVTLTFGEGTFVKTNFELAAPWIVTSIGAGLVGSRLRQMRSMTEPPGRDESYESARRLLTQLRTVARRLSAGLDPVGMSAHLLTLIHDNVGDERSAVFVRTEGGVLAPLGYRGPGAQEVLFPTDALIETCWAEMEPAHCPMPSGSNRRRHRVALPLRVGSRMIGVVLSDVEAVPEDDRLQRLMHALDEHALRIETAMAFDEVRSIATAEERRRLAREIHDGVAQEIASLGYTVDDLASTATSGEQRTKLIELRRELTRVVNELRLSIFDLRSEIDPSIGLGSALSDYVRQVGSRSNMTVHLTLDEAPTRLRAEVETELLRIAQEAITNARRHSGARNLWVDCRVHPPSALIRIRDDGAGLGEARDDSYGLRIMKERAERIAATLRIDGAGEGRGHTGTLVSVSLGEAQAGPS